MAIENILGAIDNLSEEERAHLLSLLKPGVTVVFCGSSVVSYGAAIQINGNSDDLKSSLDAIPPDALGEFVKAIAQYIVKYNR
jgi:hypothetical protein